MSPDRPREQNEPGEESERARPLAGVPLSTEEPEDIDLLDSDVDDELDTEDESLLDSIEDEPRTVLITGACGNIGRKLRRAWADAYDLVLIDRLDDPDDPEIITADLEILDDEWITHFHGVDTVVHLAANTDEHAPWDDLIGPNIDVLANVFHAAALAGVERIVFASSNHVMGRRHNSDNEPIDVDSVPMPDGPYAVTKLIGERLGRSLGRAFDMTFIALRLGHIQEGPNRPDTLRDDWARQMWLSNADLIRLFDCAVEAEIDDRSYVVVNGMSRNHGMRWDLSEAAELLGYLPEDDAFAEAK
jgi:NAD+ dependent glucose-6-phosphate dehydrogenase